MTDDKRNLRLCIGSDAPIKAYALQVSEAINDVPVYSVEYRNETRRLETLLGQSAEILLPDNHSGSASPPRRFHGVIHEAELVSDSTAATSHGGAVRLMVRPFLALLQYSARCQVFQNKSSVDILKEILNLNGQARKPLKISAKPPRRDICIQYNETDLAFVSRILAEDGVAFYWGDSDNPELLTLHDSARPFPGTGELRLTDASTPQPDQVRADNLRRGKRVTTGKVALTSYDIEKARQQATSADRVGQVPEFKLTAETAHLAAFSGDLSADERKRRAGHLNSAAETLSGESLHPAAYLGQALKVGSESKDIAGDYVVSAINYVVTSDHQTVLRFSASPRVPGFVPERHPRPCIPGVHNAVVVGGDTGTPVQDAEGRVKVRFLWDTSDKKTDTSCWLRVASSFSGDGSGALFTPRAGQEVLVAFLNGDPDAPIIIGSVYNGKNKHLFMAAGGTKSGVVTGLSKDTTNELEFDDKRGSELLALRAAKDFELTVTEAAKTQIGKTETRNVKDAASHTYKKTLDVDVTKTATHKGNKITLQAQSELVLKVGSSEIKLSPTGIKIKGTQVEIAATKLEAKAQAQFKLSGGTGAIQATGPLSLKGLQLNAEGQAMATVKAGGILTVQGSGMTNISGGIVKIN